MPHALVCTDDSDNEDQNDDNPITHQYTSPDIVEDMMSVMGMTDFSNHRYDDVDDAQCSHYY
jgi:hypothetical protein